MEMESSRRSAMDRSREPSLKRPRLVAEGAAERDRAAASNRDPRPRAGGQPLISRPPRAGERDDVLRGGSHQELVAQYKTALAELMFNSKPIITNLTIIAGESLHAAKEIAAVICANVLEVPSEQKLPSLYLLDSIVKNIGRDYIKYFSARLPEVFCKAYKQVDSSLHSSMRHLFGTWGGVFPHAPLQIIEKELGFPPVINGSSVSVSSKLDSQPQRSAHSIHVNPKYLEARQHLQQSSRTKDIGSDEVDGVVSTLDDAKRSDRIAMVGNSRQLKILPTKMPNVRHPQRELINNVIHEKKGLKDVRGHELSSDFSRGSDLGIGRVSEGLKDLDGHDSAGVTEAQLSRRNGFDVNHSYGIYRVSGSTRSNTQLTSVDLSGIDRSKLEASRSWKNSEEEEYKWDDMKTRTTDYEGTKNSPKGGWDNDDADKSASLQRGKWIPLEAELVKSNLNKVDSFSQLVMASKGEGRVLPYKDIGERLPPHAEHDIDLGLSMEASSNSLLQWRASSEYHPSSFWAPHEAPPSVVGLNYKSSRVGQLEGQSISFSGGLSTSISSSLPLPGLQSSTLGPDDNIPGSSGTYGQQRQQSSQLQSMSSHLPPSSASIQQKKPQNSIDHDHSRSHLFSHMGQKPLHLSGQLDHMQHVPGSRGIFSAKNHAQPFDGLSSSVAFPSETQQPEDLLDSDTSTPFDQLTDHLPLIQQLQHDLYQGRAETQSQPSPRTERQAHPSIQSETQSQPSHQTEKLPALPVVLGAPHGGRDSGTIHSNNPAVEASREPSTSSLLAAILNSGLFPNNSVSNSQKQNIQPPLPIGPPPTQVLTSAAPSNTPSLLLPPISLSNVPDLKPTHFGDVMPPLPPGPPPSSSLVGMNSEKSKTSEPTVNSLSSLLSSLAAKGLISSPSTELPTTSAAQLPNKVQDQCIGFGSNSLEQIHSILTTSANTSELPTTSSAQLSNKVQDQCIGFGSNNLGQVPSILTTSAIPPLLAEEPSVSKLVSSAALFQSNANELKDLIGIEFKSEIVRGSHPSVIRSLFDDLEHQCHICGLRFRLQEQLQCHLDWHVSNKSKMGHFNRRSRKWFLDARNWVSGTVGPPNPLEVTSSLEEIGPSEEDSELMVPADESQSLCALCGEPFEDIYSEVRDEWMYKGAVYLDLPNNQDDTSIMDGTAGQLLIVHAHCMSQRSGVTSGVDMDIAEHNKVDRPYEPSRLF